MADPSPDYENKRGSDDAGERPLGERLPEGQWREERRQGDRRLGERRLRDRRQENRQRENDSRQRDINRFWYDFMRFNLTGWSVVIPTLIGLALGNWIDQKSPSGFSWTLALMAAGLFLGCLNAWYWIRRQDHNGRHK